jgi:uncharacterized coiled-coil protein SlyX
MAVDKKILEQCIQEASDGDPEMVTFLTERYSKNDALAAKFVGGYTRSDDYTKKTQALAAERQKIGDQSAQLTALRGQLEASEKEKNQILKDLAGHRITVAKARELMTILGEKFDVTEEDLPGMGDLIATAKSGKPVDNTDDIDTRLEARLTDLEGRLEKKFAGAMIPELSAMAALPMIWNEISREHNELTGKALSFSEQQDILKTARAENKPLKQVWEEKYQVTTGSWGEGLRMQKRDERMKSDWEKERETADAKRRQDEALNVVTPAQREMGEGPGISAAFKTKFRTFETDPNKPAVADRGGVPTLEVKPGQHVRQDTGNRIPAAQRAAAKFLEKGGPGGYGKKVA